MATIGNVKRRGRCSVFACATSKGRHSDVGTQCPHAFRQRRRLSPLAQNPDGFVVNSNRVPVSSYFILHRASCKWINIPDRTNWTTTGYIKTCSNDLTVLSEWAEHEVGGSLKPCKSCKLRNEDDVFRPPRKARA